MEVSHATKIRVKKAVHNRDIYSNEYSTQLVWSSRSGRAPLLNDIVICTAALLLDPVSAFIVGGIGAFIGDMLFYPAPMFVSLITHGLQAAMISLIAHHMFKKHRVLAMWVGVAVGAVIMVVGYSLGRAFIYSTPEYALLKLPYQILQAAVGAVCGVLICHNMGISKLYDRFGK